MQTKPAVVKITKKPGMAVQTEVKGGYGIRPLVDSKLRSKLSLAEYKKLENDMVYGIR